MPIKIVKNGPYLVSGKIPLDEKIIIQEEYGVRFQDGKKYDVGDIYSLCRCGHSKNKPFCDGSHIKRHFNGQETDNKKTYMEQAKFYKGPLLMLADVEKLCAFARFCHSSYGDAWNVTEQANTKETVNAAVKMACECPSGRLVIFDGNGPIEPTYEQSISVIKDPSRKCNGPLFVKGNIPVISADGDNYEIRNRVTLCCCGESQNKPFCDSSHVALGYKKDNN